jgi:non-canonical purine NTP pyrophosphatase (RdgB/HAM1 family)
MIYFITSNKNKFNEVNKILNDVEQLDMDLLEIQTLDAKEIIKEKLKEAARVHKGPFIVEDTGLYLTCMDGLPGPFIKFFLNTVGRKGVYKIAQSFGDFDAEARTHVGYYNKGEIKFFEGIVKGKIIKETGPSDFGWDPIFVPEGYNKSFQQMTREEKNAVSMRGRAVKKLKDYLDSVKN